MTYSNVLKESLEKYQTNEVDKSIADNPLSNSTAIEKVSVIINNKIKQDRDDKEKNDEMERAIIANGICEDNIKIMIKEWLVIWKKLRILLQMV